MVISYSLASRGILDRMEFVAVGNHARLDESRRGDSITWGSSCRLCCGDRIRSKSNNTSTGIGTEEQVGTVSVDFGVPLERVGEGNLMIIGNALAGCGVLDRVELVAVGDHSWLDRGPCAIIFDSSNGEGGGTNCHAIPFDTRAPNRDAI